MHPIAAGSRLHTRLFLHCLAGVVHQGCQIVQPALPHKYPAAPPWPTPDATPAF